jgi:polyisoprenyl-phosphate glycosyltransferase
LLRCVLTSAFYRLLDRGGFMRGLCAHVGLRVASVLYVHELRHSCNSQLGFKRLWRLAIDGLVSFASAPRCVWRCVGIAIAVPAGIYAAYFVARTLIYGIGLPGHASLATMMLFLNGVKLISLGVSGEYARRVYGEAIERPLYVASGTVRECAPLPKLSQGATRLSARKCIDSANSETA